jgi:enamine deaminase RidA (YjgF/YER057c/UK114 family)
MKNIIKLKTGSKYEELGSYSRAVVADDWIFISNTAGRDPKTGLLSDNAIDQAKQVFSNIVAVLDSVDSSIDDVIVSRVFIQNPEDTFHVMEFIGEKFKGVNPATTVTCPPLGSTDYKVEIEITALKGKKSQVIKTISLDSY